MSAEHFSENNDNPDQLALYDLPVVYDGEFAAEDRELDSALEDIWDIAIENHLDPFPTNFEVVPADTLNQIAAYGIPGRYSHWTYGRTFRQLRTQYDYGLSKIYELVINSNPAQAYLLENNPVIENKFVMAHVLGHTDFFKNNRIFADTRRDMPHAVVSNAQRIRSYEDQEGELEVEQFLDAVLATQEHVDPYLIHRSGKDDELAKWKKDAEMAARPKKSDRSEFADMFERRDQPPTTPKELGRVALHIPPKPDRDVLGFIRNHAPYLEEWQRDTIDIVRNESIYFHPQGRTKMMNEGWASYWHKRIMHEMDNRELISNADSEVWWQVHASVVAPNPKQLNPYYLGMKMYEYLEDYYNGNLSLEETEWLTKQGEPTYPHFEGELKDSPAAERLREVMILNDDQSFIRNYFDKNVADRLNMYVYEEHEDFYGEPYKVVKEGGWQDVRDKLTEAFDNSGTPMISVTDGDYKSAGELYLTHQFDGRALDEDYIQKTLPYIYQMWQRPVHLQTVSENGVSKLFSFNGRDFGRRNLQ